MREELLFGMLLVTTLISRTTSFLFPMMGGGGGGGCCPAPQAQQCDACCPPKPRCPPPCPRPKPCCCPAPQPCPAPPSCPKEPSCGCSSGGGSYPSELPAAPEHYPSPITRPAVPDNYRPSIMRPAVPEKFPPDLERPAVPENYSPSIMRPAVPDSYASSSSYDVGNVARDTTTYRGSYVSKDSDGKDKLKHLPLKELPSEFLSGSTKIDSFKDFINRMKNKETSSADDDFSFSEQTTLRRAVVRRQAQEDSSRCTDVRLSHLIAEGIDEEGATATKLRIISMARVVLKVPVDVICSRGHFSYHIVSRHFCELRVRGIVCLIFQH